MVARTQQVLLHLHPCLLPLSLKAVCYVPPKRLAVDHLIIFFLQTVRKLLGQCGTLDVQDCIASVNYLIDIGVSESGLGMQFVEGGSHGGFLTAHCKWYRTRRLNP